MEDNLFKNLDKLNDLKNHWTDALTAKQVLTSTFWNLFENNEALLKTLTNDLNALMNKAAAQVQILKEAIEKEGK